MSGDASPPETSSTLRCPRCGGAAAPRHRRESWNPFLVKKAPALVTCEDCGLDFDPPPELPRDSGRDSGRGPWSRSS